jgi:hypothetical protein
VKAQLTWEEPRSCSSPTFVKSLCIRVLAGVLSKVSGLSGSHAHPKPLLEDDRCWQDATAALPGGLRVNEVMQPPVSQPLGMKIQAPRTGPSVQPGSQ